jgi:hypothetical protein
MNIEILFGHAPIYPEMAVKLEMTPLTWWQEIYYPVAHFFLDVLLPAALFGAGVAIWQVSMLWSLGAFK